MTAHREPSYLFGGAVDEAYVYTGTDYTDELRDHHGNTERCTCYDPATLEYAPDPCMACLAAAEAWA